MTQGKFITFEGGDGVGKSTQIARLADRLCALGIDCVVTREPGGTPFAERVRTFILEGGLPPHPPMSEALLFAAARHDHVTGLVVPALEAGRWVLCDRFADSTRAYQGAAGRLADAALKQLEALSHGEAGPDLTLILDLDPVTGAERISSRASGQVEDQAGAADPFEGRDFAFHVNLRQAFLDIARQEPVRCRVIDAARDAGTVEEDVWAAVSARFGLEAG